MRRITRKDRVPHRTDYVLERCRGRRVLHLGACDWPFTEEKYRRGTLLYARIDEVAEDQLGIDRDTEGATFLNSRDFRRSRIEIHDIDRLGTLDLTVDIIIFGETLEHLMNLEVALTRLKGLMDEHTELLISVPNAYFIGNFLLALFGLEYQHPDHSVSFSYKTLSQLLRKTHLRVEAFKFTSIENYADLTWKGKAMTAIGRAVAFFLPMFASTLLVVARK